MFRPNRVEGLPGVEARRLHGRTAARWRRRVTCHRNGRRTFGTGAGAVHAHRLRESGLLRNHGNPRRRTIANLVERRRGFRRPGRSERSVREARFGPMRNAVPATTLRPFNSDSSIRRFPVVGVAERRTHRTALQQPPIEAVYLPLMPVAGSPDVECYTHAMTFVVRAPAVDSADALVPAVRSVTSSRRWIPQCRRSANGTKSMEVVVALDRWRKRRSPCCCCSFRC